MERAESGKFQAWPVCDSRGVIGVLSLEHLRQAANEGSADRRLADFVDPNEFPHVHVDHGLHVALERMGASQLEALPVVSRANVHQLRGVVTRQDVLAQYGVAELGPAGSQER